MKLFSHLFILLVGIGVGLALNFHNSDTNQNKLLTKILSEIQLVHASNKESSFAISNTSEHTQNSNCAILNSTAVDDAFSRNMDVFLDLLKNTQSSVINQIDSNIMREKTFTSEDFQTMMTKHKESLVSENEVETPISKGLMPTHNLAELDELIDITEIDKIVAETNEVDEVEKMKEMDEMMRAEFINSLQ